MKEFNYTVGLTHSGVFHADDVFSAAFLRILKPEIDIKRVREVSDISENTIVFDIGYGRYDHHQKDAEVRANGVKYAAFGLLWRDFGHILVNPDSVSKFDEVFVQAIDDADNGGAMNSMTHAISAFIPNWNDVNQDMDQYFNVAVELAKAILGREIIRMRAAEMAVDEVSAALKKSDGVIVVLERFVHWTDVLVPSTAKFVVFPSLRGGFSAQAVPSTIGSRDQKVPFPAEWAGQPKDRLEGFVHGLTFCHPARFIIGCETAEDAIAACRAAIEDQKSHAVLQNMNQF